MIELTRRIQEEYRGEDLSQICTTAAIDAALVEMDREFEQQRRNNRCTYEESTSDMDSFVSALDVSCYWVLLHKRHLKKLQLVSITCALVQQISLMCSSS